MNCTNAAKFKSYLYVPAGATSRVERSHRVPSVPGVDQDLQRSNGQKLCMIKVAESNYHSIQHQLLSVCVSPRRQAACSLIASSIRVVDCVYIIMITQPYRRGASHAHSLPSIGSNPNESCVVHK